MEAVSRCRMTSLSRLGPRSSTARTWGRVGPPRVSWRLFWIKRGLYPRAFAALPRASGHVHSGKMIPERGPACTTGGPSDRSADALIDTLEPRTAHTDRPQAAPERPSTTRTAAVVVLYHPDPVMLSETLRRWLAQVDLVLCVDNGMPDGAGRALEGFAPGRLRYLAMGRNAGLGAAHNRGIAEARAAG
ncbi:MAG: glycosyltransferase, partial [Burkholderiales bacterium]